jgi:hypothetical protein
MRGRNKCVMHSFFLHQGFVPLGFPGKVFNEAFHTQKDIVLFFLHYNFFSTGFYFSKVLMRHILDGHPRGSVININSGCPNSKWVNGLYY